MTSDPTATLLANLSQSIALLIDLAEQGEIDPWDVQVIEVIDRYLSQAAPHPGPISLGNLPDKIPNNISHNNFAELSYSGQAFLYASMLVLLKSDSLMMLASHPDPTESETEDWSEVEARTNIQRPQNLEQQLRRRAVAPTPQRRRVTLHELVEQLQQVALVIAAQNQQPRRHRLRAQSKTQTAKAIAQLAHQENLTETAAKLDQLLAMQKLQFGEGWIDLEQLLAWWAQLITMEQNGSIDRLPVNASDTRSHPSPIRFETHDRVGIFWALLLLSAQSKVELAQDEFYQDLKVRAIA
ncbi:MAG: segregation/condensation protein A [Oscillatoriales cyanobacterium RM1_1_9]|nr:segregation/condensation protein A [Oscillatoriales cyanobacterium SM2_3_0]NJO45044.1 segregation/condensation protein A [Oscillatoriales cyanobacterium RM2_1_1]NJO71804.1 segregation/condensation protein A [Oscillatoriales cyanobacterium RM1_1_9]